MAPPRLVYDDDCGFCTWCAAVAYRYGAFELVGFSEVTPDQRARLPDDWRSCTHLLTDDDVYSCGEAVERGIVHVVPLLRGPVDLLRRVPGYERLRERLYRFAADHRDWWGKLVRLESA